MSDEVSEDVAARAAAAAHTAWPSVHVPDDVFVRRLAELGPECEHAADVYLAIGCSLGLEPALRQFHATFGPEIDRIVSRVDRSPSFRDEAVQVLHERLLVSHDGKSPRISVYAGRAPLRHWLRVIAKRIALDLAQERSQNVSIADRDEVDLLVAVDAAPELAYVQHRYGEPFAAATRAAFRGLTPRERTLLRLYLVERMTLTSLGTVYDVSHATIARWLAGAREKLVDRVRSALRAKLDLTASEFDSLAAVLRSHLDVRVDELLAAPRDS